MNTTKSLPVTDGQVRTAAARGKRTRIKHERWAAEMRACGWLVEAPETPAPPR